MRRFAGLVTSEAKGTMLLLLTAEVIGRAPLGEYGTPTYVT